MSIDGARGIVFTVTGGPELSMSEVNEAAKIITAAADEEAKIIFGAVIDEKLKDQIKITVVATGFDGHGQGKKQEAVWTNYTPNTFIVEKDNKADLASTSEDKNKTKFSSVFKNLPIKPTPETKKPSIKAESNLEDEEDDLTIPTFLRKKMG